ncbi:serine/threonine-protein kinase [Nakamurella aerolata]|uniref:serine/threonine-protein kinase n=1 Tax=Nakamurella aerolata TaxID=1656892 RepID=UPI001BB15F59|nr:serine/threonine-protein kinase [Nakamurella aerolata]
MAGPESAAEGEQTAPMQPDARVLIGRYRLESVIGRGAMGTVWRAYDDVVHRRVAIKEINLPHGMPTGVAANITDRTLREARAIGALSHPHVITLHDILTVDGQPYIVMELLHARSLAQLVTQLGPLPPEQAATVGIAVASGLMAAHRSGITHRDVKPGNVLVGYDGRVKLTDFGIARTPDDSSLTATGLLLGSPAYISPEVASGEPAGPASDAWGLGAMLFAAVQGRPPFDRSDPIATLTAVMSEPVPDCPAAGPLAPVISGLLTKNAAERMTVAQARAGLVPIADDPTGMEAVIGTSGDDADRTAAAPSRPSVGTLSEPRAAGPAVAAGGPAVVPPPPWASTGSAGLEPLPAGTGTDRDRRPRWLLPAALALAVVTGLATFFGARALSDWGRSSAAAAARPAAPTTTGRAVELTGKQISGIDAFASPSGNIICSIDADGARCLIKKANYTSTVCTEHPGRIYAELGVTGRGAQQPCTDAKVNGLLNLHPVTAAFGSLLIGPNGVRCNSQSDGIRCVNNAGGYFRMSQYRFDSEPL